MLVAYNKTYSSQFKYDLYIYYGNNCENSSCTFTDSANGKFTQLDPVEPFLIDLRGNGVPMIVAVSGGNRVVLETDG